MEVMLSSDLSGRVVGTIAHNGAHATVTGFDGAAAIHDLRVAVDSAVSHEYGECFWQEAMGQYRWLFRREGDRMRVVILLSSGTMTGWEDCFWSECGADEFRDAMHAAFEACPAFQMQG